MNSIELWLGDCLDLMNNIQDGSVDLVFADLPYGTTQCKWDEIISFKELWKQYKRVGNHTCSYVFTSSQPFTSKLVFSNIKMWRYELVWEKTRNSHPFFANKRPLPQHETIQVFSKLSKQIYNPQKEYSNKEYVINKNTSGKTNGEKEGKKWKGESVKSKERFPHSVIKISNPSLEVGLHPTQKPLKLMEYLIKTYSNEGMLVLDNVMGSGTTGLACKNLNRRFIGIEKENKYYNVAVNRMENE